LVVELVDIASIETIMVRTVFGKHFNSWRRMDGGGSRYRWWALRITAISLLWWISLRRIAGFHD
jgi:hypothetical protein